MKYLSLFIILLASSISIYGQSTEFGVSYLFTSEKLAGDERIDIYEDKVFHSFGISGRRYLSPNAFINAGVNYRKFGARLKAPVTTTGSPNGNGESIYFNYIAKGVEVPVALGYYLVNQNRIRLGTSLAVVNFFLFDQLFKVNDTTTDLEQYESYIFSARLNVELNIKLSKNISLNLLPFYQKQLSSNLVNQVNGVDLDYKQRTIGLEFGLNYKL